MPANGTAAGPRTLAGMVGKRVQIHDETWAELQILGEDRMMTFQELADEAFNDLLKKHGRPANLKDALRKSVRTDRSADVIPLRRHPRTRRS